MKVLGICGSPKKENSTTLFALKKAMEAVEKNSVDSQILVLSQYTFSGCLDCGACRKQLDCSIDDDFKHIILPVLKDPGVKGMIYASPVYFGGVTWLMKAFLDRSLVFRRNGFKFENRVAGVLTVGKSRHGGQELAAMDLVKNCLIHGMIVVPDCPTTSHFGGMLWSGIPEGIENDRMGIETAVNLGKKVAEIVKKLYQ
ncbi:MAG: flavodoxin family protein [Candidatus Aminicenantes bacterium]|nr:MAG: flavodoxin family protein [Candidatus Aminicenantes bacterium]